MSRSDLELIRVRLDAIIAEASADLDAQAAARAAALDERERELAGAAELLTDSSIWRMACDETRAWMLRLIDAHSAYLQPQSSTRIVLDHLRAAVQRGSDEL